MKKILAAIWNFISQLWKKATDEVKLITPIAVQIVNAIKTVNESTTGDIIEFILEAVIPGKTDDAVIKLVREKLKDILPKVLTQLNIANSIANISDPNEQLKAIINAINMSPDESKNFYYHGLCTLIINNLADGKLTWSESVQIAEYYYTNIYKKQ